MIIYLYSFQTEFSTEIDKNRYIFRHLKMEIALTLTIPASN